MITLIPSEMCRICDFRALGCSPDKTSECYRFCTTCQVNRIKFPWFEVKQCNNCKGVIK